MQGWAYIDKRWVATSDLDQINAAMKLLKSVFDDIDQKLSDEVTHEEAERLIDRFDHMSKFWNQNAEFLSGVARRQQISEVKTAIRQLKWPLDAADAAGSSS